MYTSGFGEIVVDILTTNPAIKSIASASSILDTSNYTFNAVTFGKDAAGFQFHSHTVSSQVGNSYNDGFLLIRRYNTLSPSSYHSSATHNQFSATYNSVPSYPSVYDTRLERGQITFTASDASDVGHYLNAAIDSSLSNAWNVIGGYPPSGNVGKYKFIDFSGGFVFSGNLSGVFNSIGVLDKLGYIKIADSSPSANFTAPTFSAGPILAADSSNFSATPNLTLSIALQKGDGASLAAFGGVNHIGIYCLDIKRMLAEGLRPPYTWNSINNTRKYKLIAKITSWKDLLHHDDYLPIPSVVEFSGYNTFLVDGANGIGSSGPVISLSFNFK